MDIDEIKKLYEKDGLSAREIGEKRQMSEWQIYSFMKKNNIKRRKNSETKNLQYQRKELSFNKKSEFNSNELELYYAGLMLYWGEGAKSGNGTVDFANSNETMVSIFLKMLRKIYSVDEKRLRILLYCYSNQNVNNLTLYWSKKLKIPRKQFIKPYVRQNYNPKKINKMPFGLVHVRYNDKKLFILINEEIKLVAKKLINNNCWGGGAVNRT